MAWKMEGDTIAVVGGNPVWIDEAGQEVPADYKAVTVKIATLNRENGAFRTENKEYKEKLAAFSGIEDPAEALKGIQFMASMDGKKVMDDEGIQRLIQAAVKPVQAENAALKETNQKVNEAFYEVTVGEKIATSEFLKKTIYTPQDAKALYGKNFKVEDGKTVGYDSNGSPIYSASKPGELAGIDEALAHMINSRPDKDSLYRGTGVSGTGSEQSNNLNGAKPVPQTSVQKIAAGLAELNK